MSRRISRVSVSEKSNTVLKSLSAVPLSRSTFNLSFALEILGQNEEASSVKETVEGQVELGTCLQGFKIQYRLSPTNVYDLNVFAWSNVAKVCHEQTWSWVRTWNYLDRRWLSFTIRHAFNVKVMDFIDFVMTATIIPLPVSAVASAKEQSVYFPPAIFGQNKFFAPALENYPTTAMWLTETIWKLVEFCIPPSEFDGEFDSPLAVADVRHQDSVLYHIKDTLSKALPSASQTSVPPETERSKPKSSTALKSKNKSSRAGDMKIEMRLPGHTLLAGIGRVVAFEIEGSRNPNIGEVVVTASAGSLPTRDDTPIVFINVTALHDAPIAEFQNGNITEVYTRWKCGGVVHASKSMQPKAEVHFKDNYVLPMAPEMASLVIAEFTETPLEIELRGIRQVTPNSLPSKFFGTDDARDKYFDKDLPKTEKGSRTDLLIAVCRVDVISLSKGNSAIVNGEFPLYPPNKRTEEIYHEDRCTNDINRIRVSIDPEQVASSSMVLEAQMTLRVSVGYVGCTPPRLATGFMRLYCSMGKDESASQVIEKITSINEKLQNVERLEDTLTGWMCDVGSCSLIFLEGSTDEVFRVWDFMRNFYPHIRIIFSPSNVYAQRMYHDFLDEVYPFMIMKLCAPLAELLAWPELCVRPALPNPTRTGLLKMGRLAADGVGAMPTPRELPTAAELRSLRLELCQPPMKNNRI